jgi:ABC-2 type transport system permease protein
MAVYEHTYRPYEGAVSPSWSRFLILARYSLGDVFHSRLFSGFFAMCFALPVIMGMLIYLHYNASALSILGVRELDLVTIDGGFFRILMYFQVALALVMTVIVGPSLISRDMANNAVPLYLARPFSRFEYVIGKMSPLVILLSAITWVPAMLLFILQVSLAGREWWSVYGWVGGAILLVGWTWILVLTLMALGLSAWIKWRIGASAALFGMFIIPNALAFQISLLFRIPWAHMINPWILLQTVTDGTFRQPNRLGLPSWMVLPEWAAWAGLAAIAAVSLLLLARKVRAYEVIS